MKNKQRSFSLDLIRSLALITVVGVHFFLNSGFNEAPFSGGGNFIQGLLAAINRAFGDARMFMILTGYLCINKQLSRKYYKGLIRIVVTYLVISVVTWAVLSDDHSISELILGTTAFKIIGYSWYVEMYIGLFLIIPFMNVLLKELFKDRRKTHLLLITLALLSGLPKLVNRSGIELLPDYWVECGYPLFFYAMGAYIRHYQPEVKHKALVIGSLVLICLLSPVMSIVANHFNPAYQFHLWYGKSYSIVGLYTTTAVFMLMYKMDCKSETIRKAVSFFSKHTYDMYLFSFLFDSLLYPIVMERYFTTQGAFGLWFVPMVAMTVGFSLAASVVKSLLFDATTWAYNKIKQKQ